MRNSNRSQFVSINWKLFPFYIREVAFTWSTSEKLAVRPVVLCFKEEGFLHWLPCIHWYASSSFHCMIWLQSQEVLFEMCVCLGGALKVATQRDSLWSSVIREWMDMRRQLEWCKHKHAFPHTGGSLGVVCTVPGRTDTHVHSLWVHTHTQTRTLRLTYRARPSWAEDDTNWAGLRNTRADRLSSIVCREA